jgi:rare lipoprotein A
MLVCSAKTPWPRTRIMLVTLLFAVLTSCSHMRRGDGPPGYDVDVSKIPNPIPKPEPLAKYGNMPSYKVSGKRYYPMKSSSHFEQVGTASWYGTMFHNHRTSSGEKYNLLGMTAAHKTLPLPTYVEVTNLKNHRQIIVKVNDRGPFSSNRIIDLSYVAAKKLGMLGRGTALVKIRAINPYTYADSGSRNTSKHVTHYAPVVASATHAATTAHHVYLQAGAFKNKTHALKLQNRLASMLSFPVHVSRPAITSKLYRVQIGPIRDLASAEKISQRLKSIGISANKIKGI